MRTLTGRECGCARNADGNECARNMDGNNMETTSGEEWCTPRDRRAFNARSAEERQTRAGLTCEEEKVQGSPQEVARGNLGMAGSSMTCGKGIR